VTLDYGRGAVTLGGLVRRPAAVPGLRSP